MSLYSSLIIWWSCALLVLAQSNYCEWLAVISTTFDDIAYYGQTYLFPETSCTGTSCSISSDYGATSDVENGLPSSSQSYTCDGTIQYAYVAAGPSGGVPQQGYVCVVRVFDKVR